MHGLAYVVKTWVVVLLISCATGLARADDESADARQAKLWQAFYKERAQEFLVEQLGEKPADLQLVREPIQTWTNPIRGDTQHGTVHLWLHAGRPAAIGSVWSALDQKDRTKRNLCYEFHSLSELPLSAKLRDKTWWSPKEPGIRWLPLNNVPAPAASRVVRLRQMREIVRELQGEIAGRENDLRILSQPLYRYPEDVVGALDGAIFAFVIATDPEIFVILEAQEGSDSAEASWRLAPARFTGDRLRLKRGEQILWEDTKWEYRRDRIYDFLYGVEQYPLDPPG